MWQHVVASREAVWLQKLMTGLFLSAMEATCILCENQSCIKLSENPMFYDKLKHIKIRYHYIKDIVKKGEVRLQFHDYRGSRCGHVYQVVVEEQSLSTSGTSLAWSLFRGSVLIQHEKGLALRQVELIQHEKGLALSVLIQHEKGLALRQVDLIQHETGLALRPRVHMIRY
jgi:hypothetical protein